MPRKVKAVPEQLPADPLSVIDDQQLFTWLWAHVFTSSPALAGHGLVLADEEFDRRVWEIGDDLNWGRGNAPQSWSAKLDRLREFVAEAGYSTQAEERLKAFALDRLDWEARHRHKPWFRRNHA